MRDDLLQLLTAAVDGELSPAEARLVKRLLAESAEARALYGKLKADAERLRALPKVPPPADLHKRVMARVAALPLPQTREPKSAPAEPARRKFGAWVPVAVAAGVLVGVAASSFFFFADQHQTAKGKGNRPADADHARWLPADNAPRPSVPLGKDKPFVPDRTSVAVGPEPRPVPPVVPPGAVAVAPEPRAPRSDLIGFPPIPETRFDLVEVRVPFLKLLADFDREDVRQQLTDELALDPAFRIDLFARDPNRAVAAFQAAAKSSGLTVHADAATIDKLRKQQAGAAVIYTESLTAAEVAALVEHLAREDAKHSPRLFDQLHAVPASAADSQELKTILGVDLGLFKRPTGDRNPKADPSKPISAGTADQIVKSVHGGKAEKSAVLLTWSLSPKAQVAQTTSAELKQYLAKRGVRPAEAVPVVIVIRPGN